MDLGSVRAPLATLPSDSALFLACMTPQCLLTFLSHQSVAASWVSCSLHMLVHILLALDHFCFSFVFTVRSLCKPADRVILTRSTVTIIITEVRVRQCQFVLLSHSKKVQEGVRNCFLFIFPEGISSYCAEPDILFEWQYFAYILIIWKVLQKKRKCVFGDRKQNYFFYTFPNFFSFDEFAFWSMLSYYQTSVFP